jgi:hypothetical protein
MMANGVGVSTRNGWAKQLPEPLTTVYNKPRERVLFWADRDANPFFHFFECLWMVAGRQDVEWISQFNSTIDQFSDDGQKFHGAYGHRWHHHFGFDQLKAISKALWEDSGCRRQVLSMWDPKDLLRRDSKDVPCNTSAYFQRNTDGALDLMVLNRSNDLIWGAYGANAVHFSFLLDLMAQRTGMSVGRYYQVSMNTHVYERHFGLVKKLADFAPDPIGGSGHADRDPYAQKQVQPYPICAVANQKQWNEDLTSFMAGGAKLYNDPFFANVADPLLRAWNIFQAQKGSPDRIKNAVAHAECCAASDWKKAAIEWLQRR